MTRITAPRLAIATALGAVLGTSAPAMAQLEEVIVTAQKREQGLLDVPISVATLSGERFTSMFVIRTTGSSGAFILATA